MSKSAFTDAHQILVDELASARREAGILQEELSARLGKDQSMISRIENGQRRIDVVEFHAIARAMDLDPIELFASISKKMPSDIRI
jgi:transcriptional regulator with XRE-family HTH domain